MRQNILSYLEANIEMMVKEAIGMAKKRSQLYRNISEIEMSNLVNTLKSQYVVMISMAQGKKISEKTLTYTLADLAERRVRQGYPLSDVLSMFQCVKETCSAYLEKAVKGNTKVHIEEIIQLERDLNKIFYRFETGIIEPYLEFQNKIILAQESFLKHKFSSLFKLIEAISNNLNIQEFCELLLDYVCRFYDVKVSGVFLLDEKEKELYPQHVTGLTRKYKNEQRYSVMDAMFRKCLQEGTAQQSVDAPFTLEQLLISPPETAGRLSGRNGQKRKTQNKHQPVQENRPLCSTMVAPMIGRQRTYGVVSLHCYRQRVFQQNEIQQFETLARIIAVALENARFYQNIIEEKGKLDAIVNSITDGLVLIDFHEEVVFINDQAARYFQQPAYRLLGASASVLSERLLANAKDPHILQSAYLRALTNIMDHPVIECTLFKPDMVDVRLNMFPVRDRDHHFIGRGIIIKDMSHENEVNRMKSEFVAIASHTMRTPMTSILGFASLLLEKPLTQEIQQRYVSNIHREAMRLTNLMNDMLDLMNIESGKISLKLMPFHIGELVKAVVREFKQQTTREIGVTGLDNKKMPRIIADRHKVMQAIQKIIHNAIRYTDGKIKVSLKKVSEMKYRAGYYHSNVSLDQPGLFPAIAIAIEDQGKGIVYDQLDSIFEPFHRVNADNEKNQDGSGLGLTIARYIIEAHGGKLWVETKPEKGSVFYCVLPLELTSPEKSIGPMAT